MCSRREEEEGREEEEEEAAGEVGLVAGVGLGLQRGDGRST